MAAGRRGGYSGIESRDRVSEFDVSRREYVYSKDEYDYEWIRNTNHENNGRGRVRYARERIGVRQKDVKEREVIINGGYRSSSSRSGSGSSSGGGSGSHGLRRPELSLKAVDREPGELSSESGSDDAAEIESVSKLKDNEVSKVVENGTRSPLERKRNFSRIVWDGDDNDVGKSRKSPVVTALPPPPPLPMAYQKSPNVVPEGGVHISPIKSRLKNNWQSVSPTVPSVASRSVEFAASESPVGSTSFPLKEQWGNELEVDQVGDEDYAPSRNISSSRWAAGNSSPADGGEILVDEKMPKRRKKMPISELLQGRVRNKSISPEHGEHKRVGFERSRSRSSESDEHGNHVRSLRGDEYCGQESENSDYMQMDEEHNNDDNVSGSDTDSKDEIDSRGTPEPAAPPQRSINMLQGCRSVDEFERLNKIDEGTYGVVYRVEIGRLGK